MARNVSVQQFELRKRIQEAFEGGRYFITVTTVDKDPGKLNHYYAWENFPQDDVIPVLGHIANQIDSADKGTRQ